MNEQIEQLVKQAGIELPDDSAYNGHIYRNSIERLARMIVRECLDIIEDEDDGSMDTKAVRWAMIRIKKHFGIDNDDVADNPQEMLEFLAGRMEFAGIAEPVAKSYAKNIRKILKQHFGVEE